MGLSSTLSLVSLVSSYFMFQIIIDLRDISYDYWSLKSDYVLCVEHYNAYYNRDINVLDTSNCNRIDRTLYSYIADYSSEPAEEHASAHLSDVIAEFNNPFQQYIPINIGIYLFKNARNSVDVSTYSLLGMESMMLVEHKRYNVTCLRNINVSQPAQTADNGIRMLYEYLRSYHPTTIQSTVLQVAVLSNSSNADVDYTVQVRNMLLAHSKHFQLILPHEYRQLCSSVLSYSVTCYNIASSHFKYDFASNSLFVSVINDEKVFAETTSKQLEKVASKQYYGSSDAAPRVLLLVASSIAGSVNRVLQRLNLEITSHSEGGDYIFMQLHKADVNKRAVEGSELPPSYTSTLNFDFNYGINQAHLKRVCLFNRTSLAYINTEIPAHLRDILSRSSSGFHSPDGSSGYDFVGWQPQQMVQRVHLVSETVAMMSPVFNNNIFHAAQTYMALVYAVQSNLSYVEELDAVIVPTVHSKHEVNYCIELLRVIVSYVESKRKNRKPLAVLFQEDVDHEAVHCFEDLHVLGSLELALPLISSVENASDFRDYVYEVTTGAAETSEELSPNDPLKVTIVARSNNRHIMNLDQVISMLLATGLCDVRWLRNHSFVQLETLSFEEQVALMQHTDVLITAHGAQLTNLMFLSAGSAVIEVMTAPWYEYGYVGTAIMFGIHYATVAMDAANSHLLYDCEFKHECLFGDKFQLQISRRDMDCYSMRLCNANISIDSLEVLFIQASQYIRIQKRDLTKHRQPQLSARRFYQKSYVDALDKRDFITE